MCIQLRYIDSIKSCCLKKKVTKKILKVENREYITFLPISLIFWQRQPHYGYQRKDHALLFPNQLNS